MPTQRKPVSNFVLLPRDNPKKPLMFMALLSVPVGHIMRPYAWATNFPSGNKTSLHLVPYHKPLNPADIERGLRELTLSDTSLTAIHTALVAMAVEKLAAEDKNLKSQKRLYDNSHHADTHRAFACRPQCIGSLTPLEVSTWRWTHYKESPYIPLLLQQLNGPWISFSGLFDYRMFKQLLVNQLRIRKSQLWHSSVASGGPRKSELATPRLRLEYLFEQLQVKLGDSDYIPQLDDVPSPVDDLTPEQFARMDDETMLYMIAKIQNYVSFAAIIRQVIKPAPACVRIDDEILNKYRGTNEGSVILNPTKDIRRDTLRVVLGTAVEYEVIEGELVVTNRLLPDLSLQAPSRTNHRTIYWSQLEDLAEQYGTNLDL